jgi:hypothetical protein
MSATTGTARYDYPLFVGIVCNGPVASTKENETVDRLFAVTRFTDRVGNVVPMMTFPHPCRCSVP